MDINAIGFVAFLLLVFSLTYINRKKLEIRGVLILYKTKRFRNIIEKTASAQAFWKVLSTIGVVICFYLMLYGSISVLETGIKAMSGELKEGGVKLILPAPVSKTETGYAYILLPFWMWILAIFFIIVPHEFFHGVIARTEKIPLKSVGLLLFLIFPGAFVEVDEKRLGRKGLLQKLRVFAAGSFANFLVAFFVFLLGSSLWNFGVEGVVIEKVLPNSPAEKVGMGAGEIIKSINGIPVKTSFAIFANFPFHNHPEKLTGAIAIFGAMTNNTFRNYTFSPGEEIFIETNKGNYTLTLEKHPDIENAPFIGITVSLKSSLISIFHFLSLLFFLSVAIGILNILPIYPLDGGQMIKAVFEKIIEKRAAEKITSLITMFFVLILVYTLIGPIFS